MRSAVRIIAAACLALLAFDGIEARQRAKRKQPARSAGSSESSRPRVEYLTGERRRPLPFSDAVRVGHMLYLSGQIGTDEEFSLVAGGVKAETKQTMENIGRILERHGSSFDRVVKCTVMLVDMKEWGDVNEIYVTYFDKGRLPARSALGASGLALGARVEIECWATVD